MIVVDASAVLEALLRTPAASAIERRLFEPSQTLHAPHLLDVEVAQVVRRYAANGEFHAERGRMALDDLADLPLRLILTISFCRASGTCGTISRPTMPSMSPLPRCSTLRSSPATNALPRRPAIIRGSSWCESRASAWLDRANRRMLPGRSPSQSGRASAGVRTTNRPDADLTTPLANKRQKQKTAKRQGLVSVTEKT
jgi:hypothetical protein